MNSNTYSNREGYTVEFETDGVFVQMVSTVHGKYLFRLYGMGEMYTEEVPFFLTIPQCIDLVSAWKENR